MTTTPPEQGPPQPPPAHPAYGYGLGGSQFARLPIPGNAELAVYLIALIVVAIVWAASDSVGSGDFVTALVVLTAFYMLSRGIAKASRVLEQ